MANTLFSGGVLVSAETVGNRIRERRETRGWSISKLARAADVSQGYLSDVENGKIASPSGAAIGKLAEALHTSSDYLLGLTDDPIMLPKKDKPTPQEQLAEMGVEVWARGHALTQEDVDFIKAYLETREQQRKGGAGRK